MRRTLSAVLLLMSFKSVGADCVVLLHGLARSAGAMETMQQALTDAGYHTVNVDYPSRKHAIEALAPMVITHTTVYIMCLASSQRKLLPFE